MTKRTLLKYSLLPAALLCLLLISQYAVLPALLQTHLPKVINSSQDAIRIQSAQVTSIGLTELTLSDVQISALRLLNTKPIKISAASVTYSPLTLLAGSIKAIHIDGLVAQLDLPDQLQSHKQSSTSSSVTPPSSVNLTMALPPLEKISIKNSRLIITNKLMNKDTPKVTVPFILEGNLNHKKKKIFLTVNALPWGGSVALHATYSPQRPDRTNVPEFSLNTTAEHVNIYNVSQFLHLPTFTGNLSGTINSTFDITVPKIHTLDSALQIDDGKIPNNGSFPLIFPLLELTTTQSQKAINFSLNAPEIMIADTQASLSVTGTGKLSTLPEVDAQYGLSFYDAKHVASDTLGKSEACTVSGHVTGKVTDKDWQLQVKGQLTAQKQDQAPLFSPKNALSLLSGTNYSISAQGNQQVSNQTSSAAPSKTVIQWNVTIPAIQQKKFGTALSSQTITANGSLTKAFSSRQPEKNSQLLQESPSSFAGPFSIHLPALRLSHSPHPQNYLKAGGNFAVNGVCSLSPTPTLSFTASGNRLFMSSPEVRLRRGKFSLPLKFTMPETQRSLPNGAPIHASTPAPRVQPVADVSEREHPQSPTGQLSIPDILFSLPQDTKKMRKFTKVGSLFLTLQHKVSSLSSSDLSHTSKRSSLYSNNVSDYLSRHSLQWKGQFTSTLLQGLRARIKGALFVNDSPNATTRVTIKGYKLAEGFQLSTIYPPLSTVTAKGTLAAAAQFNTNLSSQSNGLTGNAQITLADGEISDSDTGITIQGITASIEFPNLPAIQTAPLQRIAFKHLLVKDVNIQDGEILFMMTDAPASRYLDSGFTASKASGLPPQKALLPQGRFAKKITQIIVESARFNWLGGQIVSLPFQIIPNKTEYDVTLFCSQLKIAQLLSQLGFAQAKGEGRISGKIPVSYKNGSITFNNAQLQSSPESGGNIMIPQAETLLEGIPQNSPQYLQMKIASEALKDFEYKWAKVTAYSEGNNLKLSLQLDGNPARNLPFEYSQDLGILTVQAHGPGMKFQGVRLDVNFNLPLDRMLRLKELFGQGE